MADHDGVGSEERGNEKASRQGKGVVTMWIVLTERVWRW